MELFDNLALGFSHAVTLPNIGYAFIGCLLGTLIGVLPGIGAVATISMLLPFTYGVEPLGALIMIAGIYYGAQYGGSTTAILVNLPGETSSVVTMLDGHQMARQGRAGVALATAAIGSFFAGCVGTFVLAAFATPLSEMALAVGPADYFALMVVGLVGAVVLTSDALFKALAMIVLGLLLGLVGSDVNSGVMRFTFGFTDLWEGIELVVLAVGLFATAEIVANLDGSERRGDFTAKVTSLFPTREDFRRMVGPILRGSGLGVFAGILPGAGASIASFMSCSVEKKISKTPEMFGKGAIEGVAGPEAANNSAAQCAFIPTLTLGIPGGGAMALLLGALTIHNIQPGPQVITRNPDLFWGLIASMWIGNLMLVILNLPLIGIWVRLLRIPYRMLYPAILLFCCIGVYSVQNSTFDVLVTALFGIAGYFFHKLDCPVAPLTLGFVLGPMLEEHFRRAMILSRGDFAVFFTRPISATFLGLAALLLVLIAFSAFRGSRKQIFLSDDS
jgi:putative tricarboxylic transport membrane protein